MPPFPHEKLPTETWSLSTFNAKAREMLQQSTVTDFVNLTLAGRWKDNTHGDDSGDEENSEEGDDGERRISIDPFTDCYSHNGLENVVITRDFDSLIGITNNLPLMCTLAVYPVPNFRDRLMKSNHLDHSVTVNGTSRKLSLHLIPNVCLGKVGVRAKTMVFFPKLYQPRNQNPISQDHLRILYDSCIRPVVNELFPTAISHWPVSYSACLANIRDNRGQLHFKTLDISRDMLQMFSTQLREKLNHHPPFQNSFFVHEWRGIKGYTRHDASITGDCDSALLAALEDIDLSQWRPDGSGNKWFIDVGVEVHSDNQVLQWRTDAHLAILEYALPTAALGDIQRAMTRKSFQVDHSAQLYGLGGFRWEVPKSLFGEQDIRYVNVYTTDKSATYQLHPGAFRRHRSDDLFPDKIEKLMKDIDTLSVVYEECAGERGSPPHYSNARLEVRLALAEGHVNQKFRDVSRDLVNSTVVGFDPKDWWEFRWLRLCALNYVFQGIARSELNVQWYGPVLHLGAVAIWILNALIFRAGDHTWDRLLIDESAFWDSFDIENIWNADDMEIMKRDGEMRPALASRGAYFLSAVVPSGTSFRMPVNLAIDRAALAHIFNVPSYDALQLRYQGCAKKRGHGADAPVRRRTRRRVLTVPQPYSADRAMDLGLAASGLRANPPIQLAGPDITVEQIVGEELNEVPGVVSDLDQLTNQTWQDFLRDLVLVAPSQSTGGQYCTLTPDDMTATTEALYQQTSLPFRCAIVKLTDPKQWDTLLFDRYFPTAAKLAEKGGVMQNWSRCHYWPQWNRILREVPSASQQESIRRKLLVPFQSLTWLPYCSTDRIWRTTRKETGVYVKLPAEWNSPSPVIALNSRAGIRLDQMSLR